LEKHALSAVEGRGQGRFSQVPRFQSPTKSPSIPLLPKGEVTEVERKIIESALKELQFSVPLFEKFLKKRG
jgi:hypothetical protein